MEKLKKIGLLTSGGDAPGMNAAIRAVVRAAHFFGTDVIGIKRGYEGLLTGDIQEMSASSVSDIIHRGGTILHTARCHEMMNDSGVVKAAPNGLKAAVVGSGPAGISAAHFLALAGYAVTVFEREARPGGMLRYALPQYRMDQNALDRELDLLKSLGVEIVIGSAAPGGILKNLASGRVEFEAAYRHGSRTVSYDGDDVFHLTGKGLVAGGAGFRPQILLLAEKDLDDVGFYDKAGAADLDLPFELDFALAELVAGGVLAGYFGAGDGTGTFRAVDFHAGVVLDENDAAPILGV